jgi:sensor histidine kinase regulating citrate/malate metabolism
MNEMYDTLSILHNDYKYHLSTISELMNKMEIDEIKKYLSDAQAQLPDTDIPHYCNNSIVNALLASYAKRCLKENIEFDIQLTLPDPLPITNYDICIILGNLLENAMEACEKLDQNRKISLVVKIQGMYLAVMVSNNYSGIITAENNQPISTKKNGGFGLRSVRTVTARYEGHTLFEWDAHTFTAYMMLKMNT